MPDYHLAQLNIGRLRAPIDSPRLAPFVARLDPVNALADAAPGFVWRLVADGANDATQIRPYEDETLAVNLSVWTSLEALWNFVYRSAHLDVMRRRREFFHRMHEPYEVLWWLPAGELPSVEEAVERLAYLRAHGPSAHAFTFKQRYPAPVVSRGGT
jgi:uncharacterized protein DUF3291